MGDRTGIEWTDATLNWVSGCSKISEACEHCYAERDSLRYGYTKHPWTEANAGKNVVIHPERLDIPLKWKRPRRIFVCSMGDLFHPQVPFKFICDCFARMTFAKQHTFQVLTKRPERALEFFNTWESKNWPLPNVQMIVTAENQKRAYERIPLLLQIPAAVHGVSIEPMLSEMDLTEYLSCERRTTLDGIPCEPYFKKTFGTRLLTLDWVIVGGESGPGARMTNPSWIRSILDQCKAAGVPFFMKQAGEVLARAWGCKDRKGGNPDEWPEEFRVREFPS